MWARTLLFLRSDIGCLSALASPQKLGLFDTQVTDDIGSLSALANLQRIDLVNTKVEGNIGSVSGLTSQKSICLSDTQVTDDVGGRNNMAKMRLFLCLRKTKVVIPAAVLQTVPVTKNVQVVLMPTVSPAIKDMAGLAILSSALTEKEIL